MPISRPYHDGDLRNTLLKAGIDLIREVGPKGFTIREVARRAGVSHNAPYRHFKDKDELVAAIVDEGFQRLVVAMKRRAAKGKNGIERLSLSGYGYVDFALHWPGHFLAMFDLSPQKDETEAGERASQTLLDLIIECQNEGAFPAGDPYPIARAAWSLVHGIAKLALSGQFSESAKEVLEFTTYATSVLVEGLRKKA
jgi:AcrR family transcriptional regulator